MKTLEFYEKKKQMKKIVKKRESKRSWRENAQKYQKKKFKNEIWKKISVLINRSDGKPKEMLMLVCECMSMLYMGDGRYGFACKN